MTTDILNPQEIAQRGEKIYRERLKKKLEKGFLGKYVAIEVESEKYFVGSSLEEALEKARKKFPDKIFHSIKIGSEGIFTTSGLFSHDTNEWPF